MASSIDTHPQRQKIIDAIVAEQPYRDIIAWTQPRISSGAIARFKRSAQSEMRSASRSSPEQPWSSVETTRSSPEQSPEQPCIVERSCAQPERSAYIDDRQTVPRAAYAVASSPFRPALANLMARTERVMDRAEEAVRVVVTDDGIVPVGADVQAIAPLLREARGMVELLGRATGELDSGQSAGATNNTIILNVPR